MIDRCLAYLDKLPMSIQGQSGSDALMRAAGVIVRFGLSIGDEVQALNWYNENRCNPRWSAKELEHKLNDARRTSIGKPMNFQVRYTAATKPVTADELIELSAQRKQKENEMSKKSPMRIYDEALDSMTKKAEQQLPCGVEAKLVAAAAIAAGVSYDPPKPCDPEQWREWAKGHGAVYLMSFDELMAQKD